MTPNVNGSASVIAIRDYQDVANDYEMERYALAREITVSMALRASHLQDQLQRLEAGFALRIALPRFTVAEDEGLEPTESMFDPISPQKLAALDTFMLANSRMMGGSAAEGEALAAMMRAAGLVPPQRSWPVLMVQRTVTLDPFNLAPLPDTVQVTRQMQWVDENARKALEQGKIFAPINSELHHYKLESLYMPQDDAGTNPTATTDSWYCLDRYAGYRLDQSQLDELTASIAAMPLDTLPALRQQAASLTAESQTLVVLLDDGKEMSRELRKQRVEIEDLTAETARQLLLQQDLRDRYRNIEDARSSAGGQAQSPMPGSSRTCSFPTATLFPPDDRDARDQGRPSGQGQVTRDGPASNVTPELPQGEST